MTRDGKPENRWEQVNAQLTELQLDLLGERQAGFTGSDYLPSLLLAACRDCRREIAALGR